MLNSKRVVVISLVAISFASVLSIEAQQDFIIPQWVKNNALWWSDGDIQDAEFISGIKFLIEEKIIVVSTSSVSDQPTLPFVPNWIKDTAGWWATGKVSDVDFVNGLKWLIENGIIQVSATELNCEGEGLCIAGPVNRIIDGDTLIVAGHTLRLSLTDTPEKDESGFAEATEFTRTICPIGSKAIVDQDDTQLYDIYHRLVGKVFCGGKNLNAELLYSGNAEILTSYCNDSEFSGEDWAQEFGCGIPNKCDPSYPDVCISPYPPDLDCGDISFRNFTVLQPDPHRFDGDKDGIGCEEKNSDS